MLTPTLALATALAGPAFAQDCPDWMPDFAPPGASGEITDMARFHDGFDDVLFAVGRFGAIDDAVAEGIARWDGQSWRPVGGGVDLEGRDETLRRARVLDMGGSERLFVVGDFQSIGGAPARGVAAWSGQAWDLLGGGPPTNPGESLELYAVTAFDSGSGSELYVGGSSQQGYDVDQPYIARWDGATWTRITDGPMVPWCYDVYFGGCDFGAIYQMDVFDDGSGDALFVAGDFTLLGAGDARVIARYDGTTWSSIAGTGPGGITGIARQMEVHDDGTGAQLYISGSLAGAPHTALIRWDGSTFEEVGTGLLVTSFRRISTLPPMAGLPGGLWLMPSQGVNGSLVLRNWNGTVWTDHPLPMGYPLDAMAFGAYDSGSGDEFFLGGLFPNVPGVNAQHIARWDGSAWQPAGQNLGHGLETQFGSIDAWAGGLAVYDDGSGQALYVGGRVAFSAGQPLFNIAKWTGSDWSAVPGMVLPYLHNITDMLSVDLGSGSQLWIAGDLKVSGNNPGAVATWNGSSMQQFFTSSEGHDLEVFDSGSGPRLYAVAGSTILATSDGVNWQTAGIGRTASLVVHDDGTGPQLYAAGDFPAMSGVAASNIARYDGTTWTTVGAGLGSQLFTERVEALQVFDDGTGMKLYAGGDIMSSGGTPISGFAVWDGTSWTEAGGGVEGTILDMQVFDDGSGAGALLYVAGDLTGVGGQPASGMARFDGQNWDTAGLAVEGVNAIVHQLCSVDLPELGGRALAVAGEFDAIGGVAAQRIAILRACDALGASYCTASANSVSPTGAAISASGGTSVSSNSLTLRAGPLAAGEFGVFFHGAAKIFNPFGEGVLCTAGNTVRVWPPTSASAMGVATRMLDNTGIAGVNIAPGVTRHFQFWYRDPAGGPSGFNLSDALSVTFEP